MEACRCHIGYSTFIAKFFSIRNATFLQEQKVFSDHIGDAVGHDDQLEADTMQPSSRIDPRRDTLTEDEMLLRNLTAALTCVAAAALIPPAMAVVPIQTGVLYAFHTDVMGACHGTDWYVYVDGDKSIDGYAAWDRGHERATLSGQINEDGSIHSVGQMMGSTRSAAITGQLYDHYFTITVNGSGTPCDGLTWKVPRQSWTGAEVLGGAG